jgi:Lrp/AsnC family leucine-responsive transcriptional regulator
MRTPGDGLQPIRHALRVAGKTVIVYEYYTHAERRSCEDLAHMDLDSIDRRILRAMQLKCTLNADELAQASGVSPSTALRRLRRLRDARVIVSEVAIVDPKKLGRPLQMIASLKLKGEDAKAATAFRRQMCEDPMVMMCYFVTGSADYVVHVTASDMSEFNDFVQSRLVANPHVVFSETNVVIEAVKVGLALPIDA